jgi:hypothetical protein
VSQDLFNLTRNRKHHPDRVVPCEKCGAMRGDVCKAVGGFTKRIWGKSPPQFKSHKCRIEAAKEFSALRGR